MLTFIVITATTFIAWGDSGYCSEAQYRVADQMARHAFDLALHTGDLTESGAADQILQCHFCVYARLLAEVPFYPALGNREYGTDGGRPYLNAFDLPENAWRREDKERYYSFDWQNVHFAVLDSERPLWQISPRADDDMADWLEADLAASERLWKIAVVHRPPYSGLPDLAVRDGLVPIFEAHGVDLVLSGHRHNYERSAPINGVTYIVTGGGGAPLHAVPAAWHTAKQAAVHHFIKVRVGGCALSVVAIGADGAVMDAFALDKCPHHFYAPIVLRVPR